VVIGQLNYIATETQEGPESAEDLLWRLEMQARVVTVS
jgi:hypothetical protein